MSVAQMCIFNCVRLTKWIPVFFVFSVIGWSYYAYVVVLCFGNVDDWIKKSESRLNSIETWRNPHLWNGECIERFKIRILFSGNVFILVFFRISSKFTVIIGQKLLFFVGKSIFCHNDRNSLLFEILYYV